MEAIENQAPQRPGRVLAAERERQGLAPADIAQRLHMSVSQVEALERDDYAPLPRGPFLKGFVRNYAKTLGLAPEGILALLAEGGPREPAPRIIVPSQNIRFEGDRLAAPYLRAGAIATVLLVLGFAAMYWWLFIRNAPMAGARKNVPETVAASPKAAAPVVATAPAVPASPPVTPPPAEAKPATADAGKAEAVPPKAEVAPPKVAMAPPAPEIAKAEAAKSPVKTETPKAEAPKPAPARVAATDGGSLKFRFKGKSWVEIRDAGNKVIATGLNDAGSETEVVGKPPFKVIVGNAPEVRMYFNDREFDLAPYVREAVARVTVE